MHSPRLKRFVNLRSVSIVLVVFLTVGSLTGLMFYQSRARRGAEVYRVMCANCHGANAEGGRGGPALTGELTHGQEPWNLFRNISNGIPGTGMSSQYLPGTDVLAVVAHLRTLRTGSQASVPGDVEAGSRVFSQRGCDVCHTVPGRGEPLGPDLSRIGAMRPAAYLAEKIRNPSREITEGYETVTVVKPDGARITGIRVSEDTFSVQIRDLSGNMHSLQKNRGSEVIAESRSMMPAYDTDTLSAKELEDLVAYLVSLKSR